MATAVTGTEFAFDNPQAAIAHWLERTTPIAATETVSLANAAGRILAQNACSDRPSPPCTVSAMDGYVFHSAADLSAGRWEVAGEVCIGQAPPAEALPAQHTMQIFTGAPLPTGCDVVIKREDVEECKTHIVISDAIAASVRDGQHIRYQGENASAGTVVAQQGSLITMPVAAALAGFGYAEVSVYRKLKVTILTTGDELRQVADQEIDSWEIRNSNGPALANFFGQQSWLEVLEAAGVVDDYEATCEAFRRALDSSDAVIATGGVSMGDHDYVPGAVQAVGGEVVFHKLPVRPGKPMLAAVGADGQVMAGLPGNPVSVMVAARRTTFPILQKKAGLDVNLEAHPLVALTEPMDKPLHLYWYRPVRLVANGLAELVAMKGSGDFGASAASDGFVEIAPHATHVGPWPYWSWQAT